MLTNKLIFCKTGSVAPDGGTYVKYKTSFVPRGFQQLQEIDYEETFDPAVQFTTHSLSLAIVLSENVEIHQVDVKNAFVKGDLSGENFMEEQESVVHGENPDHVCKLLEALYWLEQAPRQWFAKINNFFVWDGIWKLYSQSLLLCRNVWNFGHKD